MKINKMKKTLISLEVVLLTSVFFTCEAFPWGYATHAYIDDHIGKTKSSKNINEIYGGMAPDMFNYMFESPYLQDFYIATHYDFMKMWDTSKSSLEKSFAYGFVSHNDMWGVDYTAHHSGITYGQTEGYVIAKSYILKQILEQVPEYQALQLPDPVALEISHNLIESGIDILMKRSDPLIGEKIVSYAIHRNPQFPNLLVREYAEDFSTIAGISYPEAVNLIKTTEKEFRKTMILYGQALKQDETTAIQLISEQTADLAEGFLGAYGITLPEGTDITPLITFAIQQSIEICADDFSYEIEATINYVEQQMNANGITY